MSTATATRLEEAIGDRGWAVLPLKPGEKGPHARVLHEVYGDTRWKPLAERRASRPEVEAWLDRDPDMGLGIITGQPSGGLIVIDQDKPVTGLRHPPGPIVQTGRGAHLYAVTDAVTPTTTHAWGEVRATAPTLSRRRRSTRRAPRTCGSCGQRTSIRRTSPTSSSTVRGSRQITPLPNRSPKALHMELPWVIWERSTPVGLASSACTRDG